MNYPETEGRGTGKIWYALRSLNRNLVCTFTRYAACRGITLVQVPLNFCDKQKFNGQERIRTSEAQVQQIYSLPPLATWVPAHF